HVCTVLVPDAPLPVHAGDANGAELFRLEFDRILDGHGSDTVLWRVACARYAPVSARPLVGCAAPAERIGCSSHRCTLVAWKSKRPSARRAQRSVLPSFHSRS